MHPVDGEGRPDSAAEPLHRAGFRLSYADCDPAGIVYYATYYEWMERTHTEWWFLHGMRFDELPEKHGIRVVTRAAGAEFLDPLRLFETVECRMHSEHIGRTSFTQRFEFHGGAGRHTARARMSLVCLDLAGRPVRVPERMRALLAPVSRATG